MCEVTFVAVLRFIKFCIDWRQAFQFIIKFFVHLFGCWSNKGNYALFVVFILGQQWNVSEVPAM